MLQGKPQNKQGITNVGLVWPLKQIKVTEKHKHTRSGLIGALAAAPLTRLPWPARAARGLLIAGNIGNALH